MLANSGPFQTGLRYDFEDGRLWIWIRLSIIYGTSEFVQLPPEHIFDEKIKRSHLYNLRYGTNVYFMEFNIFHSLGWYQWILVHIYQ
jgi:hypothetical protein